MIGDIFLEWMERFGDAALYLVPMVAFLEACVGIGLFVSGAVLLTLCTVLYSQELATLPQMLPLAFLGAAAADNSGFLCGRLLGPGFHQSRFAKRRAEGIGRAEALFTRYGAWAIVIGRLVPAIRSLVPMLAGISGMPARKFWLADLFALVVWLSGLGLLSSGLGNVLSSVG